MGEPAAPVPRTIADWQTAAEGLLSEQCCAFHRNIEISASYAWVFKLRPGTSTGAAAPWIAQLRRLVEDEPDYAPVLRGFEAIDRGRVVLDDPAASPDERRSAEALVWQGNVLLLEHEQRTLVQPHFDRLSCAFARLLSLGSATSFEVRGVRREVALFTSFYGYSLTRGAPHTWRARTWPRMTRFDDRWRWLEAEVVPRFRRFEADADLVDASLRRIFRDARVYASAPCFPTPARDPG